MKGTKIIAAFIAGTLTLGAIKVPNIKMPQISIVADAASELTYGDFQYTINNDSYGEYVEITRYIGADNTIVVPRQIKGIPVKSIGVAAFGANDNVVGEGRYAKECVQKVTIPEGVTTIKKWAFSQCKNLKSVSLPDSLKTIGSQAFWLCDSLENVTIPKNASNPDGGAFMACRGMKKVVFSEGVTEISDKMFSTCTILNSVTIPDTVTSIGDRAFGECKNLKEINIPDSVEVLGEGAFYECSSLSNVKLSDNLTSIQALTFNGCSIKEITLPYYVSSVGTGAFDNSLEIINISAKLKSVDTLPLNSKSLKAINVPDDNSYYSSENGILYNKAKTILIRFPAALKETEYMAPKTVVTVSESAFKDNTNIRNIYLYEKCSSVEPTAFQNCSHLDKIYFYNKNCDIYMSKDTIYEDAVINGYKGSTAEEYADMYGRAFNSFTIDLSILSGKWQAYKVELDGYELFPDSNSTWQNTTFTFNSNYSGEYYTYNNGNKNFQWKIDGSNIVIGELILEFNGTDIELNTTVEDEDITYYFKKVSSGIITTTTTRTTTTRTTTTTTKTTTTTNRITTISHSLVTTSSNINKPRIIDQGTLTSTTYWEYDSEGTLIIGGTGKIPYRIYYQRPWDRYREKIKKVVIENGITSIGSSAFEMCSQITEISIADSVVEIGDYAFSECENLKEIKIPKSVTSIGECAFNKTIWLKLKQSENPLVIVNDIVVDGRTCIGKINIPDSIRSIADRAFGGCNRMTEITIPTSVKSIGNSSFSGCSSLKTVIIPDSVTSIGTYAFYNCSHLTEIIISNNISKINANTFDHCTDLKEITIPASVISIEDAAFTYCYNMDYATILNPKCSINNSFDIKNKNYRPYNVKLLGYENSTTQEYAKEFGFDFESIGVAPTTINKLTYGDTNVDGIVDLSDAVLIMQVLANPNKYGLSGSDKSHITAQGAANADVEGNNGITANDALTIQKYLLKLISSLPV